MENSIDINWRAYLPFIIGIIGGLLLGFGLGVQISYQMASDNAWNEFQMYMEKSPCSQQNQNIPALKEVFNVTNFGTD